MALIFKIPETIVVHLGTPDETDVGDVTVSFADYIKNVASSEIYPTWPENALRANIYAQTSFALNRIFTEHYRLQGYSFDVTNTTAYDQAFIYGRDYFENISQLVDELFNDYIVKQNDITPLFARYCDGEVSDCPGGMSQWGSVALANEGYSPYRILTNYYGSISIVEDAPIGNLGESYPGYALKLGFTGFPVKRLQACLNRISKNYPAIPKIAYPDGIYDIQTEAAVRKFQEIFNLEIDGICGKATWYKVTYIFFSVKRLSELNSEIISMDDLNAQFQTELKKGDSDTGVIVIQNYLNFISEFNDFIPTINSVGTFDEQTENSVKAFQLYAGLPQTGVVDETTWNAIYSSYVTKYESLPLEYRTSPTAPYPGVILALGSSGEAVSLLQKYLSLISKNYRNIPPVEESGYFGKDTQDAVLAYEREFGFPERGFVNLFIWRSIAGLYSDLLQVEE